MERTRHIRLLWLALPFLWQGCAEDKGNYDYGELNELGISFADAYSAVSRERFRIKPEVTAEEFAPDAYDYEWKAYDESGNREPAVLGTTLDLDVELTLSQGTYRIVLTVTEKATGLYWQRSAALDVSTPLSCGWLVLCSDGGRVRLDMVSHVKDTGNVYRDLLKGTELEDWQSPYQLVCDPGMREPFYMVTGSGTTRLGNDDFRWDESYMIGYEFGSGTYAGTVRHLASHRPGKLFVDTSGRVYYCNTLTGDGLFGSVRANGFYVEPAIGYDAKGSPFVPAFMMWDRNNRRFVVCASEFASVGLDNARDVPMDELPADGFPTVGEELFAWPTRADRMDFVCMENTRYDRNQDGRGMTYALLGKGDDRFLYGVILGELYSFAEAKYGYAYEKAFHADLSACTDIAGASHFAFSSLKTFMYYAAGGKVWRVNFSNALPVAEPQFELPEGEEVTCLKFYLWEQEDADNRSYDLIVGSKDAGTGASTLRIYEGFANEGDFRDAVPVEQYTGFADIVDVIYRERVVYRQ